MEEKYFKRDLGINIEVESNTDIISEVGNTMTEYFLG